MGDATHWVIVGEFWVLSSIFSPPGDNVITVITIFVITLQKSLSDPMRFKNAVKSSTVYEDIARKGIARRAELMI
jgi:hypothetical protein